MKSPFALNMIKARKFYGWTQQQAADRIGINIKSLGKYEESRAEPSFAVLKLICKVYRIKNLYAFINEEDYYEIAFAK